MADIEEKKAETKNALVTNLAMLSEPDNFQKYILGTKKNGTPRALYDVVKDYTKPKKKKKKHKKNKGTKNMYWYLSDDDYGKKKKKKKKKKNKNHWHV